MSELSDADVRSDLLGRLGLPPIPYALPLNLCEESFEQGNDLPVEDVLYWLQHCSARPHADWQGLEYAMQRLLQRLAVAAPPRAGACSRQATRRVQGSRWWFELGPVALDRELVTVERDGYMLAALAPNEESRLMLTTYRPLDARSLELLVRLGSNPHPRLGMAVRENNWALAVDAAADPDNFLCAGHGGAYLAHWPRGIGGEVAGEAQMRLPPELTAAQLRVFDRLTREAAGEFNTSDPLTRLLYS